MKSFGLPSQKAHSSSPATAAVVLSVDEYNRLYSVTSFKDVLLGPPYIDDDDVFDTSEIRRQVCKSKFEDDGL